MINLFAAEGDSGAFSESLYDSTGQQPDQCGRLAALDSNPNTACPLNEIAGTNVDGIWQTSTPNSNTAGPARSSFQMACQGTNDYNLVANLNGDVPVISGGQINAGLATDGKLHCRYPGGIIQLAIQEDSTRLHGRWYEGGWAGCYTASAQVCYAGMIQVTRNANTDNSFTGQYWCDDDEDASTQNENVWDITFTLVSDTVEDGSGNAVPFFQLSPLVGQVKRPKQYDSSNPNNGPTFR